MQAENDKNNIKLRCSGDVRVGGITKNFIINGDTNLVADIDKKNSTIELYNGSTLTIDAKVYEDPNRFYYFNHLDDGRIELFEVDRTSLEYKLMRPGYDDTGDKFMFASEGKCSLTDDRLI